MLQLYERHCPGFSAILALVSIDQDFYRLQNWVFAISPIVHPQRWDPDDPELTEIVIPFTVLDSGVHPLLASILAPWVPQICLETALSFLHYLQFGGHSSKTRKSLKPLHKSSYFTRLKVRPWLSRFRNRRYHHPNGTYLLRNHYLRSAWWGNDWLRPHDRVHYNCTQVPLRSFSYQSEYMYNYDLWCTYRYALQLLPCLLANAPPDPQLASIATDCVFNSFCTAYPLETRKAKEAIASYLFLCRPIKARPLGTRTVVHGINAIG